MVLRATSSASIYVAFAVLLTSGCAPRLAVYDWPITFDQERVALSREYAQRHYDIDAPNIEIVPRVIVLHWTAFGTLAESFEAFDPVRLPPARSGIASAGDVNVSIHFLVDRDGTVYQLMPDTWMARHCIGLNYVSIGIENVGGVNSVDDLTEAQIRANAGLVRRLAERHASIEYLIGHYENLLFEGHPLWMENDDGYRTEKVDPGPRFMTAVRERVADLGLRRPPSGPR
jgi:N-acetyl-anhydromuramyl-L-alanine amidase AmpD